jgi:hypothetical protein
VIAQVRGPDEFAKHKGHDNAIVAVNRSKHCDVSLFQLGLRLLEYFLNEESPILVQFYITI